MTYVDGFIIAVPKAHKADYRAMALVGAEVFVDHGALHVVENWANDVPHGTNTDFFMAVKANADEEVVFSWIVWPSKVARDAGNRAAMDDPRFAPWEGKQVFDGKRMVFGGFDTIVEKRGDSA